jgi:hypothetical protein
MVKTPRTRHSSTGREPMTIELGPDDVSRVETGENAAATQPEETAESLKEDIGASETTESAANAGAAESAGEPTPAPADEATPSEAASISDASSPETTPAHSPLHEDTGPAEPEPARREPPRGFQSSTRSESYVAPPPPPPRPSRASALTAGLAGGIVALLAGWGLQYAGVLGSPASSSGPAAPSLPAAVETDIANLKAEIEALKSGAGAPVDISGVTSEVSSLSQALDQVKTDLAALKQSVESGGAGEGAGVAALNTKIAEIESRIAAIGPGPDGPTPQDIAALNEKIAGVEALAKSATDAGSTVDSRLGALEQSVSSLSTKVDAQAGQPKIALAIATSALKAAIERGSPFQPELETLAALAPQAPGLGELRAYAEKGVTTRADIVAETDSAAKAMIAAASPPPANAGLFERLLSSAESLVTVRPIGAVEGPGVPETVARMEVALQAGDLAKAIAEFETLPEAAKAAGAPFAEKIRARLAAEQLADQAIAAAMQAA